mmetsp:Transcript_62494/g.191143  ORF Transcript_62494/g.191143 Transcript_62494/m.191143 type:complete len:303 (-) Transcript_62494:645-1553(-)
MHRVRLEAILPQLSADFVGQGLLRNEHQNLMVRGRPQHLAQVQVQTLVFDGLLPLPMPLARRIHDHHLLHDVLARALLGLAACARGARGRRCRSPEAAAAALLGVRDADRPPVPGAQAPRQVLDLAAPRGREEQRLPLRPQPGRDADDVVVEAQVKHTVGLVQHEIGNHVQLRGACVGEVDEPARRGRYDVGALAQSLLLGPPVPAPVDASHPDRRVGKDLCCLIRDLNSKLARWRQNQRLGRRRPWGRLREPPLDADCGGQQERQRFAAARLREADDVPALEHQRERLGLDRHRRLDAVPP